MTVPLHCKDCGAACKTAKEFSDHCHNECKISRIRWNNNPTAKSTGAVN